MANTILLKRAGTAGKVPLTANLSLGELSVNYTDGRLYTTTGSAIIDLSQNDKVTLSGDATGTSTNPAAGGNYSNLAVTLATVNSTTGTFGGANGQIPTFVVNGKGLITSAANIALNTLAVTLAANTTEITANTNVGTVGFSLATTTVTAGTYGGANGQIPVVVFDSKGRATSGANVAVSSVAVTGITSTGAGNITVSGTTGAVTLALPATGPGAVNVGSTTVVPTIVTDAYGRIVSLTSNTISTSFTVAGTSGTASVPGASTLTFASTNGVTVVAGGTGSAPYANISTPQDIRTSSTPTFTGLYSAGTINAVTVQAGTIGNSGATLTGTLSSGAQNNITSLGTVVVTTGFSVANAVITGGSVNGTAIGATTASTGVFTTLNATSGINASTVSAGTIGNSGATLTGTLSSGAQNNITSATGLTTIGTAGVTTTIVGNLSVGGNLTVSGNSVSIGASTLSIQDPIINLGTSSDLSPLTIPTVTDIGLKLHYYTTALGDSHAFIGRAQDTGYLEWYDTGNDPGNVFVGVTYGTVKTGALILANARVVGGGLTANTGTFQVYGDGSITGNLYAGAMYDGGNRTLNTTTSHSNSGGDVTVSGAYNAMVLTLATVNSTTGLFGNATYQPQVTVNGKGLVTTVANVLVTPAWSSITSTPTTLTGYGITDALSTSATIDGGTY